MQTVTFRPRVPVDGGADDPGDESDVQAYLSVVSKRDRQDRRDDRASTAAGLVASPTPPLSAGPAPQYWFSAKRYGWGWGLPCAPQGWAVLSAFVVTPVVAYLVSGETAAVVAVLVATVPLVAVVARKGEPPRWRWGRS